MKRLIVVLLLLCFSCVSVQQVKEEEQKYTVEGFYGWEWIYYYGEVIKGDSGNEFIHFVYENIHFEENELLYYGIEGISTIDGEEILYIKGEEAYKYEFVIEENYIVILSSNIVLKILDNEDFLLNGIRLFQKQRIMISGNKEC